jgi:hypothetical protein
VVHDKETTDNSIIEDVASLLDQDGSMASEGVDPIDAFDLHAGSAFYTSGL